MGTVAGDITRLQADLAAIKNGIAGLNAQIQTLNSQLSAGTEITPTQAAALDQLANDADSLATAFPAPQGS